jgi:hypothetical protein
MNECKVIEPKVFSDKRGYFYESYNKKIAILFFKRFDKVRLEPKHKTSFGIILTEIGFFRSRNPFNDVNQYY